MKVSRRVLEEIERHARQSLPAECCGILLAADEAAEDATHVIPGENVEPTCSARRYRLGHRAHIKAVEMEIAGGLRIVGYYHSHPHGNAAPSPRDSRRAAPAMVYLIAAVGEGWARASAWRLDGTELVQEPLEARG